ncbi:MAG TPA: SIP domain-containing protein, partial [Acidimicrobiales bacterium]|nr:SIP domain-containing protein [Acidimicrobiales bacterium]
VAAESRVVRALQQALVERRLDPDQVSAKAYWRRGLPNTERGEPTAKAEIDERRNQCRRFIRQE